MRIFLFLGIGFCQILFAQNVQATTLDQYHLRVAVLDARNGNIENHAKIQNRALVYQLAIAEILSQDLRKIPGLFVIDRDQIKNKEKKFHKERGKLNKKVASKLEADFLVQVGFKFLEEKEMELALHLFESSTGQTRTIRRLQGPRKKILSMCDDFVFALAEEFGRTLSKKEKKWIKKNRSVTLRAWRLYGKGLSFYYKGTHSSMVLARERFVEAERRDTLFLPPYLARAKVELFLMEQHLESREKLLDKAYESLRKALFIDSKYLDAYELLSQIYFEKGDYVAAVREGLRAIRLNPLSLQARWNMIQAYQAMGKSEEAKRELEKLLELSPTHEKARRLLMRYSEEQSDEG